MKLLLEVFIVFEDLFIGFQGSSEMATALLLSVFITLPRYKLLQLLHFLYRLQRQNIVRIVYVPALQKVLKQVVSRVFVFLEVRVVGTCSLLFQLLMVYDFPLISILAFS